MRWIFSASMLCFRVRSGWCAIRSRTFVRERVLPNVAEWFEEGVLPQQLGAELGKLGVLGMHLEGYDCPGASAVAYGLACMELEAGDSGVRSFASVQGSLAMFAIHHWGTQEQKTSGCRRWRAVRRSAASGSLNRTSEAIRPACAPSRAATVTIGCSTAPRCGSLTVRSPTSPSCGPTPTMAFADSSFRPQRRVFSAHNIHRKLSLRASITSELVLQDVRLPRGSTIAAGQRPSWPARMFERGTIRHHLGFDGRRAHLLRNGA
jgi:glutaryl-CoA dehydrogenase